VIVGTAGHIDHGKTSLVRQLTGVDTDRLPEEKKRGMTIDLGFAHMDLGPAGRVGVVDVPGHERFVRNMVAGATGIDLALLVVAADDGVMPQTREHLDIVSLLGIAGGVVALTKTDLVAPERIAAVTGEIRALLEGTALAAAPVVPVSSETGDGLEALRCELARGLQALRSRAAPWPFWMAVDRVFSVRGFGVVVTGTVASGRVEKDCTVRLLPGGETVRVRGIQVHNQPAAAAVAGNRCALNLAGTETPALRRGVVVCDAGLSRVAATVDARVVLGREPGRALKNHARVRLHAGTAESMARLQWLEDDARDQGRAALAHLRLDDPIPLLYGHRFILRDETAERTVAGGIVLDPFAARRGVRDPRRIERLHRLRALDPEASLAVCLESRGADGWLLPELAERLAEAPQRLEERIARRSDMLREEAEGTVWVGLGAAIDALGPRLVAAMHAYLHDHPRITAVAPATLRSAVCPRLDLRIFRSLLRRLAAEGEMELTVDGVRARGHRQSFSREDAALADRVEALLAYRGKPPPKLEALARDTRVPVPRLRRFLGELERAGRVARLAEGVYVTGRDLAAWREQARAYLERHAQMTAAQFRDLAGIGRNLAIPVLERLDQDGVTKRIRDARVAAPTPPPQQRRSA
jgi:selenocysteine-specific elongation factor